MKRTSVFGPRAVLAALETRLGIDSERRPGLFAVLFITLFGLLATLVFGPGLSVPGQGLELVAVGRVSSKDIVSDRKISFVDEKATRLRIEAEERLVLPVFEIDERVTQAAFERFSAFQRLLVELVAAKTAPETLFLRVQSDFPGLFQRGDVINLARFPLLGQVFVDADALLRRMLERGVLSMPSTGLEHFNGDYIEIRMIKAGRLETSEIETASAYTLPGMARAVAEESANRRITRPEAALVALIVDRFIVENAFFNAELSERRLETARRMVEPVERTIAAGERILRKGLVVSESEYARLEAVKAALAKTDWGHLLGDLAFFLILVALSLLLLGPKVSGSELKTGEMILAATGLLLTYLLGMTALRLLSLPLPFYVGFILPAALLSLIFAVFAGQRFAYLYGLCLALFVLVATDYDSRAFAFTLFSAIAATYTVRRAESRMDLVRAGLRLALLEAGIAVVLVFPLAGSYRDILVPLFWGGLNGLVSASLSLLLFPVLEQLLNAPTRFRLIELSDLNAPTMKRLLAVAPGTYSHSVAVAHLAETACRDIGADPLLARVGAYYHDIGKIDQPEYFVENQNGYNRHDEINPRLSATVIRSHVKVGVEKARALGLPDEVVDIVAQHHGNCLISWFYDRASREEEVDPEDFSYPGQPPASREAAVVMLADAAEAASRTLKKPTPARIDGLIREIVLDRIRQNQLERSDLTFSDLETIRASFTKILSGHFHARIEYPKTKEGAR